MSGPGDVLARSGRFHSAFIVLSSYRPEGGRHAPEINRPCSSRLAGLTRRRVLLRLGRFVQFLWPPPRRSALLVGERVPPRHRPIGLLRQGRPPVVSADPRL